MDKTIVKAVRLLETLAASDRPCGISDLARGLDLGKSNVHRLLQTLLQLGYVNQNEEGAYELTLRLWEVGTSVLARQTLQEVVRSHLRGLSSKANESSFLAIRDKLDVVYVDKAEAEQPIQAITRIGSRLPAYRVSTGRILLAYAPSDIVQRAKEQVANDRAVSLTARTFGRELERVREDGYAVNRADWREGVWGIAAPLRDNTGDVISSIGLWGPADRLQRHLDKLIVLVTAAAAQASADLGYRPERRV